MGERMLCKHEVIGSIPFTSTTLLETICKRIRFHLVFGPKVLRSRLFAL